MIRSSTALLLAALVPPWTGGGAQERSPDTPALLRSPAEVVAEATNEEWRRPDPENTVYLELPTGRVVIELAPGFSPRHVENIRRLIRGGHFDGGGVVRSQDNYVAQWATRPVPDGTPVPEILRSSLAGELEFTAEADRLTPLPDTDPYAPRTGFLAGFPVGHDPGTGTMWMAHCYGAVGVARGNSPDSGNGTQLYAVTGHAPRHLDRNLTMVGRVVWGMAHLTTLPRGSGNLGFYESEEEVVPIGAAVVAGDLPAGERTVIELLRTDSASFQELIRARRSRVEEFFVHRADGIDLCNVQVPARVIDP